MLVVDTCVLIDIADDDPAFGMRSARCLATHLERGLVISPVSYVELAPVFDGSVRLLEQFLTGLGVNYDRDFGASERSAAFSAWNRHVSARRGGRAPKRPVADALIGAMAKQLDGIITRNRNEFLSFYPDLIVIEP
jgi:predicted nucleic acid-binding protein